MRAPVSWLRAYADLPDLPTTRLADALSRAGLKVERIESVGAELRGVVVGRVLDVEELPGLKKPIRFCQVDVGEDAPRGIVCGAVNFTAGDRVPVALPGAVLPGGVQIAARTAYGRRSDGMICSAHELGIGDDHRGILVLDPTLPVGVDAAEALGLRDDVLEVEVTPDRGYCWSIRGLAREAATAFDVAFHDPAELEPPLDPSTGEPAYEVRIEDPVGCDRYVARVVTHLDPAAPTPVELRRRLFLAGMRQISLAVDVTNLVLLELGQPLHAFDRSRLHGGIVVRRARVGERLTTLDGADRSLDPDDLLITDDSGPIALAGVMGGSRTEVGPGTGDLVIESAHFQPASIARTARRHRLGTEASRRFERGVDDALGPAAAEAAVRLLTRYGAARPLSGRTDVDIRAPREVITLPADLPGRLAGRDYPAQTVRRRLTDVGCRLDGADPLHVHPPSWRPDLRLPVDLVEEVVRLEGYDTVPSELPLAPAGRGLTVRQRLRRRVATALAAAGYVETPTVPFLAPSSLDALGLAADDPRRAAVLLANPINEAEPALRTTLLAGLLTTLRRNVSRGFPDVALFETGRVFLACPAGPGGRAAPRPPGGARPSDAELAALDAALPDQPERVAVVLTGQREPAGWWGPGRAASWADAIEAARTLARVLDVPLAVRRGQTPPWHPGRCAELVVGERVIGHAGELHPRVVGAFDLPARSCAMELGLDELLDAAADSRQAPPISAYPAATVDVAVSVPSEVPAAEVESALREGAGPLLEAIRLFDVYTGVQAGPGRRSLAFALRLRAPDRTLTAEEALAARDGAVAAAARRAGAELRGG